MSRTFAAALALLVMAACGESPTAPSASTVYRSGTLQLPQTYAADLDEGAIVPNPHDKNDLWLEAVTADERYLSPTGATLVVYGPTAPGLQGCAAATLSNSRISIASLAVGVFLCARTDDGRLVEMRIVGLPGPTSNLLPVLTIDYTTYNKGG